MKFAVIRYSVDEGQVVNGSRKRIGPAFADRQHTEWVASLRNREAAELDQPYHYRCEEVSR